MKKIFFILLFFVSQACHSFVSDSYLTVVGPMCFTDGIGRQAVSIIECLEKEVPINYISSRDVIDIKDVPDNIKPFVVNRSRAFGSVMIFEDVLDYYPEVLNKAPSAIKLAYTMFEKEKLPTKWVEILNNHFDAAVVPDEFLVDIYKKSGVTIPIFVLPLSLYLEPFMENEPKREPNKPFVFGTSGLLSDRKNQMLLLEAFAQEFANNPAVCLKIHGRSGTEYAEKLCNRIDELGLTNVEVIHKPLSWQEYCDFIKSLDCFVSLSRGEGFSITPREALAAGIPCIVSDNTAHKTLCETGLVKAVPSYKMESYTTRGNYYEDHEPFDFFCKLDEVGNAIKDIFVHYYNYAKQSFFGKLWVSRYLHRNLRHRYVSLVKPKEVIFGPHNEITERYLMTNSEKLYKKYTDVLSSEVC